MNILEYIPQPFIHALSWSILHSVWQIMAITLLWRISMWFARKAPAITRQNISIIALLTIPAITVITFFRQFSIFSQVQRIAYLEFEQASTHSLAVTNPLYIVQKENNSLWQFMEGYSPLIFWLYITGIVLFSLVFITSYSRLFHLKHKQRIQIPPSWKEVVASAHQKAKPGKGIELWLSPLVSIPIVVGFFKPVVLLPLAISASLTLKEVEDILLHEFYHIRCKDHYINALQYILEILFFYHPCTWWISNSIRNYRESKVDEWVVHQTLNPGKYAQTLLTLEQKRKGTYSAALSASSSSNLLLNRIKNIMHMKTRNFKPGQRIAALLVIAVATISLAWIKPPAFQTFSASDGATNNTIVQPQSHQQEEFFQEPAKTTDHTNNEPDRLVLEDGMHIEWDALSEEDREEIRQALAEARIAVREAMQEVQTELNSEKMKKVREEIRQAMKEMQQEFDSEEFRQEMRQAREEIRKAMKEANASWSDEEFQAEMKEVSRQLQMALHELDSVDWQGMSQELSIIMEETGKTIETIGPLLNDFFENLKLDELFLEIEKEMEQELN